MLDLNRRIQVISNLIAQDTVESATYAALECRLAIEYLCYERLQMALELVSYADLKGWQPGKVLKAVETLANEDVAQTFSVSIAPEPQSPSTQELTLEEREKLDYKLIGTQAKIDINKLVSIWNALANRALHVQVPKVKADALSIYGDHARIVLKVQECLDEFKKIGTGTLLATGFGPEVSIKCFGCECLVKRKVDRLTHKQIVSCINPECDESYIIEKDSDDDIIFVRRLVFLDCKSCKEQLDFPIRQLENLRVSETVDISCPHCAAQHKIGATLVYTAIHTDASGT